MKSIPNIFGQYQEGDSFLHRLDPRTKIISLIILSGVVFFLVDITAYIVFTLLMVFVLKLGRVRWRSLWGSLRPLSWLFLLIFLLQLNTPAGLRTGLTVIYRLVLMLTLALVLTTTTPIFSLTMGLRKLLTPLDLFEQLGDKIAFMLTMALRFIPLTAEENQKINEAQRVRGVEPSPKNLPLLVYILLVNVLKKSEELAGAIESRGYRLYPRRTSLITLRFGYRDIVALLVVGVFSVGASL